MTVATIKTPEAAVQFPPTFLHRSSEKIWAMVNPQTTKGRVTLAIVVIALVFFTVIILKKSFKAPPFSRALFDQRLTHLQRLILKQVDKKGDAAPNESLFTFFYTEISHARIISGLDDWEVLMRDNADRIVFTHVIEPCIKEITRVSDVNTLFDSAYWNAYISTHNTHWSYKSSSALKELLYYLHEARILFLIDKRLKSTTTVSLRENREVRKRKMIHRLPLWFNR
ncbi:hypothetical protein K0U07_02260 [bacterium]|nr:hypothetical protein [bacterium]